MTKSDNIFLGFFSLLLVIVLALMGCGGGSAGTGTGPVVVVQGAVLDESGAPVENVDVRVVETGSEATTSQSGEFEILTSPDTENVTLEVSSETGSALITINIPEEGGTVSVTLTVNPEFSEVNADTLEMGAAIVGRCDIYFENRRTIRQANRVPGDLTCIARVTLSTGSKKLAQIPIAIQYRDCAGLNPWTTIAAGSTMGKPNLGIGQVQFPFIDDEAHCVYRIVSPFGLPNVPELERTVITSTYQRQK